MKTGTEAIDRLQDLQLSAERESSSGNVEASELVSQRIATVPFDLLLDKYLSVVAQGKVHAYNPDHGREVRRVFSDISFFAPASSVNYLKRDNPAFEGIIVNFAFPKIIDGIMPEETGDYRDFIIMAPVVAIRSRRLISRDPLQS